MRVRRHIGGAWPFVAKTSQSMRAKRTLQNHINEPRHFEYNPTGMRERFRAKMEKEEATEEG
jgi:uncharacterized MAPEG superfamily protein